jgi:hypothetical protein
MEDHLELELTTRQVAEAFGVKPVTVSSWVAAKRLRGKMPRNARRLGRRFTLGELLLFAQRYEDEGAGEEQLRDWYSRNKDSLLCMQGDRISRTDALLSTEAAS